METAENILQHMDPAYLDKAASYDTYFREAQSLTERLKREDAEGINYPQYIPLNLQRLRRGNKIARLSPELTLALDNLDKPVHWLVITEQWCGDAAQTLPLMAKAADGSDGMLTLSMIQRDVYPELIDQFLTRNARSIPKLIQLNENHQVTGIWGPRPLPAQKLVDELKEKSQPYGDVLHSWYARDRYKTLNGELAGLLASLSS